MSGLKTSTFQLERERALRLIQIQQVAALRNLILELSNAISQRLEQASPGLRATFADEVTEARNWIVASQPDRATNGPESGASDLARVYQQLAAVSREGQRIQSTLSLALSQKADEMGQGLARRLGTVRGSFLARRQLLGLWRSSVQRRVETDLETAEHLLQSEQYTRLESLLRDSESVLETCGAEAEQLEEKHQKRLYLLKALRQVCSDMRMEEIGQPRYENPGDRGSAIQFEVETGNQGRINFLLALDMLSSSAAADQQHCFHDFGRLSTYLNDEFGIQTNFRTADCQEVPRLIRKGERDFPGDAAAEAAH